MLSIISYYLWIITTFIIILSGIYLSFYLKLPQYKLSKKVNISDKKMKSNSLKLLNLTLAGKIGVGSISGIAISIIVGGKGTILWIWLSSIIISIFTYLEVKTGIKYRLKTKDVVIGGPQVYIEKELNNKKLSKIYTFLVIITFLVSFILIQSNTIITTIVETFLINKIIVIILLLFLFFISTKKGVKTTSKIVMFLVPIMGTIYVIIGLYVLFINIKLIPKIISSIINEAFNIKSILTIPLIVGFQRSIFSNESAMGTTSMIVSLSENNNYKEEFKIQLIGMYFITLIICTISALLILTTNYEILNIKNLNGIEIINYAFNYHFGCYGKMLSTLIISLFAFSTIITSYYYGEICIKYLFKNKSNKISKIIAIIVIIFSTSISGKSIWGIVDITSALLTIINIYVFIKMRKKLKE